MSEDSGADGFIQGAAAKADLVSKAVNLEKQSFELGEQKKAVQLNKFNTLANDMNSIIATKPGKLRDIRVRQMQEKARQFNIPMDENIGLAFDPEHTAPLSQVIGHIMGLTDDDKLKAMDEVAPLFGDVPKFVAAATEAAAKLEADRAKIKSHDKSGAADRIKLEDQVIGSIRQSANTQIETINAVQRMFALGSDVKMRNNDIAKDAIRVIYAKLTDPTTGVREGEIARSAGLGADAYARTKQWMDKFVNGKGPINETQWKQILQVADGLGVESQKLIDKVRVQRSPSLIEAGLDPQNVFAQVPQHTKFDFAKAFPSDVRFRKLGKGKSVEGDETAKNKIKMQQDESTLKRIKQNIEIIRNANPGISDEEIAMKVKEMQDVAKQKLKE